jgi:PPOX class probable F420-dependent enzyme
VATHYWPPSSLGGLADERNLLDLIAANGRGILAVVKKDGHPHLSNVLYAWDAEARTARISTQADRVKGRVLRRDPKAALHVPGEHFWSFAVMEGDAETTATATEPGDDACRALLALRSELMAPPEDEDAFYAQMIEQQRLVVSLPATRVYGLVPHEDPSAG